MIDAARTSSTQLRELLNELTIDELRDTLLALRGPEASLNRNKDVLVNEITSAGPRDKIEETAARVEALTPRKHLWLFSLGGAVPKPQFELATDWTKKFGTSTKFRRLGQLEEGSPELQLRLQLLDPKSGTLYLKYEHWVTSSFWKKTGPRKKELETRVVRHPITVACIPAQGILEVRFDGYSQGQATAVAERLPYQRVAQEAATAAGALIGVQLGTLSLQAAVERLIDSAPDEVKNVSRNARTVRGFEFGLKSSDAEDVDVATDLAQFLKGANIQVSAEQVRSAFRTAPAQSVMLHWRKYQLLTRVSNHEVGPELLFIWRSSTRTTGAINSVVERLLSSYREVGTPSPASITAYLEGLGVGDTVRVTDVVTHLGSDVTATLRSLEDATARGLFTRVYRVRTSEVLHDFANLWRQSLSEFPKTVIDERGHQINLDDAAQIEVGYQRRGKQ